MTGHTIDRPHSTRFSIRSALQRACLALVLLGAAFASSRATGQTTNSGTTLYRLKTHSDYQRGCFGACECPDTVIQPVLGTFFLTPTGFDGFFLTYAVTGVHWTFTNSGTATTVTGSGAYRVDITGTPQQQELSLFLQMNGGPIEHFDSGLVTNSLPFPSIQVSISTNGLRCFDTVFNLITSPAPMPQLHIALTGTHTLVVSWAVSPDPFTLQKSSDPSSGNWVFITNTPTVIGQQNQVVLPLSSGTECYRLQPGGS